MSNPAMVFQDPNWYMPSPAMRPFRIEQRVDLTAPDTQSYGIGQKIVFDYVIPAGQIYLVKNVVCCLWRRTNIGTPNESFRLMLNQEVAGKVVFRPLANGNSPFVLLSDVNVPQPLATTANAPRQRAAGWTSVSEHPDMDVFSNWNNPLFCFDVRAEQRLQVLFEALTVAPGIQGVVISDEDPAAINRVDFASVVVAGQVMSDQDYTNVLQQGRRRSP